MDNFPLAVEVVDGVDIRGRGEEHTLIGEHVDSVLFEGITTQGSAPVHEASFSDELYADGSTALSVSLLGEKVQNVLGELSEVVQVIVQVLIDTPHIHLGVDVDEDIPKAHHLHQRGGESGRKDAGVTQQFYGLLGGSGGAERQDCHKVVAHVDNTLNRQL